MYTVRKLEAPTHPVGIEPTLTLHKMFTNLFSYLSSYIEVFYHNYFALHVIEVVCVSITAKQKEI